MHAASLTENAGSEGQNKDTQKYQTSNTGMLYTVFSLLKAVAFIRGRPLFQKSEQKKMK